MTSLSKLKTRCTRRVEDKAEAKGLHTETISLHCEKAPATKKTRLAFGGWLMFFNNGSVESNVFAQSNLLMERLGHHSNVLHELYNIYPLEFIVCCNIKYI